MKNALKSFGNLAFFLLMLAVILRPVVVYANTNPDSIKPGTSLTLKFGHFSSESGSRVTQKPSQACQLKVIPKETASVDSFAPRFSQSIVSPDSSRFFVSGSLFRSYSFQKIFVLRI